MGTKQSDAKYVLLEQCNLVVLDVQSITVITETPCIHYWPNFEWTLCYIPLWNSYEKYRKSNFRERTQNSDKSAFEWTMCYIPIEGTKN